MFFYKIFKLIPQQDLGYILYGSHNSIIFCPSSTMSSCHVLSQDQTKVDEYALGYPLPRTMSYMSSIKFSGTVIILGSIKLEESKNGKIKN